MVKIYKRILVIDDKQTISLKKEDKIIKIAEQSGYITMWYITSDNEYESKREITIYIRGTGHPLRDAEFAEYFDTLIMSNGFVWHVFIKEN